MIIVTGGAGFIGSNIIKMLNECGASDVLAVDNLKNGKKFSNLVGCRICDYQDKSDFLSLVSNGYYDGGIEAIIHMGACSATTEWDGQYMMRNNYEYSKRLFEYSRNNNIPFLYASSAAVYGETQVFIEDQQYEGPLNVYGYSKWLFDEFVRNNPSPNQVAGFRFFNVYGPGEQNKGSMASVAFHNYNQIKETGVVKLFGKNNGYGPGEQKRDFVFVKDVASVIVWFLNNKNARGIFNVGTGRAQTFNDVARSVIRFLGQGEIEYIDFPENLKNCYQSYTQANISNLRAAGYKQEFMSVEDGIASYLHDICKGT